MNLLAIVGGTFLCHLFCSTFATIEVDQQTDEVEYTDIDHQQLDDAIGRNRKRQRPHRKYKDADVLPLSPFEEFATADADATSNADNTIHTTTMLKNKSKSAKKSKSGTTHPTSMHTTYTKTTAITSKSKKSGKKRRKSHPPTMSPVINVDEIVPLSPFGLRITSSEDLNEDIILQVTEEHVTNSFILDGWEVNRVELVLLEENENNDINRVERNLQIIIDYELVYSGTLFIMEGADIPTQEQLDTVVTESFSEEEQLNTFTNSLEQEGIEVENVGFAILDSATPSESPSDSRMFRSTSSPTISSGPSHMPSDGTLRPTISTSPSHMPSDGPSISTVPSSVPSNKPSLSGKPSSMPSENPSISDRPSSRPSQNPSTSNAPSSTPTKSFRLIPSPGECNVFDANNPGATYTCLRNEDWGIEDDTKWNIDFSIETVNPTYADAYVKARESWMKVIQGNLEKVVTDIDGGQDPCSNNFPPVIDDLHICAQDIYISEGGILGFGQPGIARETDGTIYAGYMAFDSADIPMLIQNDIYDSLVTHEMGHVLGFGSLWALRGLVDYSNPLVFPYLGEKAKNVWTNDWNCTTPGPPVETDFGSEAAGLHWDEECLVDELMTGKVDGATIFPLSKLTIASLEDLGYNVDYSAADEYDGRNTTCCNPNTSPISIRSVKTAKPPLSASGRATAIEYGLEVLRSHQRPSKSQFQDFMDENGLVYLGDQFINVIFEENGNIYDVDVTWQSSVP